jgi:hypothetical protein
MGDAPNTIVEDLRACRESMAVSPVTAFRSRRTRAEPKTAGTGLAGSFRGVWLPTPIVICSCQRLRQ